MRKAKFVLVSVGMTVGLGTSAIAQTVDPFEGGRWVPIGDGFLNGDPIAGQIDRNSIQQDGQYVTAWVRVWDEKTMKPITTNKGTGSDVYLEKHVIDCANRKTGNDPLETNDPTEIGVPLAQMTWGVISNEVFNAVCSAK